MMIMKLLNYLLTIMKDELDMAERGTMNTPLNEIVVLKY